MDITLLAPDSSWDVFAPIWQARIAAYSDLLAGHGINVIATPWTEARPERPALALLAWGYHLQADRWLALLDAWPETVPLVNPAALLAWNTDKIYLAALAEAGVATVPTRFAAVADAEAIRQARAAFETDELVVKPRVSAAADNTSRIGPGAAAPDLADAMIQPFLPSVQSAGETSLFYFGGRFSHAVTKVAAAGDFRVQREYGGAFTRIDPVAAMTALAEAALAAAPVPPLYARVDMAPDSEGRPLLMEMEMIEPDLYLDHAPDGGAAFATALARHLGA